ASDPSGLPNHANYSVAPHHVVDVGAYTGTTSPYGAFDMGGNVTELTEALIYGTNRIDRGGAYGSDPLGLASSHRHADNPQFELGGTGFRLAMVDVIAPEPSAFALLGSGGAAFWLVGRRHRRRAQKP